MNTLSAAQTPISISQIAGGILGTDQTVDQMKKVILASLGNQVVRQAAEEMVSIVEPNDKWQEAQAIFYFVRDRVRYTKDPKGMEYVQTPVHLLQVIERRGQAYGDCDDKTVLGLALLKNLGFDVAIRVASYRDPEVFTHVYGLVKINHEWVPFDATPTDKNLGWEKDPVSTKDYPITPYGWDMGDIAVMSSPIDMGQVMQLALAITLGGLLTACMNKKVF